MGQLWKKICFISFITDCKMSTDLALNMCQKLLSHNDTAARSCSVSSHLSM